ncbi:peptide chain release factor N(5)-glutamine methyltransferase [Candidatus Profftia sp. (ex Adelges kitamiensis)]|uniref:peptide chain release factor N(5)-glutamine methyltransferase n=1 Tax=Candidatus Profftia sp. (ex Adelges kitamiensis) TaxID=2864218 RepID=UPI001CE31BC5|nr:peptide chain release factor N(5)-glutamine methyltransferase [Candidatus Profftia sp. (ex Adelges kitamiensis)]
MQFNQWLKQAIARLKMSKNPRRDAYILLCFITGKSYSYVLAFSEIVLTLKQEYQLEQLLIRRINNEPIAYLIGECEFWSLLLKISPVTIIPRIDTECLVERALELLPISACRVLDLGTGTGAIALALASERPDCYFFGIDCSADAIFLALSNAVNLHISNVSFLTGSWFKPVLRQKFNLIVSNPPYIDQSDPHLLQSDIMYEPYRALVAPEHGIAYLRHIIKFAPYYLINNSWLVIEHGWQQGKRVRQLMCERGFTQVSTKKDYSNHERITSGRFVLFLAKIS